MTGDGSNVVPLQARSMPGQHSHLAEVQELRILMCSLARAIREFGRAGHASFLLSVAADARQVSLRAGAFSDEAKCEYERRRRMVENAAAKKRGDRPK